VGFIFPLPTLEIVRQYDWGDVPDEDGAKLEINEKVLAKVGIGMHE
jgi:hypothetical protein